MAIETLNWTGADGAAASVANTGYDQINAAGGTMLFDDAWQPRGALSLDANGTSTSGYMMAMHNLAAATDTLAYDQPVKPVTIPASEQALFWFGTSADARQFSVVIMNDASVMVRDGASTNQYRSAAGVLQVGVPVVVSVFFTRHASAGTFRVVVFAEDGTTILADSTLLTGKNTGSAAVSRVRSTQAKSGSTSTVVARHYFGRPRWDVAASGLLPAYVAAAAHKPVRFSNGTAWVTAHDAVYSDGTAWRSVFGVG